MTKTTTLNKSNHSVYSLNAHLVFVTKYRCKVFEGYTLLTLGKIFNEICLNLNSELIEFDGEEDHVHLLISYPPSLSISEIVKRLKGVSSRKLKLYHPEITNKFVTQKLWSPSYFVSSVGGAPISVLRQYIQQHATPQ